MEVRSALIPRSKACQPSRCVSSEGFIPKAFGDRVTVVLLEYLTDDAERLSPSGPKSEASCPGDSSPGFQPLARTSIRLDTDMLRQSEKLPVATIPDFDVLPGRSCFAEPNLPAS